MPSLAPHRTPEPEAGGDDAPAPRLGSTSAVVPVVGPQAAPGVIVDQKYELVRLLGEGGMGAVWVAKHLTLDVHVALKIMHRELGRQVPGAADRMSQEARAAACIGHPAIVQVFDFGRTAEGEPFISMELLHGESLAQALERRGRLPPVRALQVLLPIADALAVAHQRGIVHRDLKPDNVFLARLADGRVQPKILDFGIAKLETETSPKLTAQGTVLGSPAYMAPEQAWGESDIDQRADVWAFAVMLYELLTGETPFQADSYNALLFAITRNEPQSIVAHGVNEPELWQLVQRCLAKDRDQRFSDMRELGRALAEWMLARGIKTDITKAPIGSWLDRRNPGVEGSLFPSLSPHDSSEPPLRLAVTQVGRVEAHGRSDEPPAIDTATRKDSLDEIDEAAAREATANRIPMRVTPLLRGAVLRFSSPRVRALVERKGPKVAERQRNRFAQFAGIAVLSGLAFVAAAYLQSERPLHRAAVPAPVPSASVQTVAAGQAGPRSSEASGAASAAAIDRGDAPAAWKETESQGYARAPAQADLHPDKPRLRARPRKRAGASSELKNPFD